MIITAFSGRRLIRKEPPLEIDDHGLKETFFSAL
jgi:hypothetical protein